jgi:hypothetical protein
MGSWNLQIWRWLVVLASAALYIVSLTQTAFVTDVSYILGHVKPQEYGGAGLLIIGWMGVIEGDNLLIFPSIIAAWLFACARRRVAAAIVAFPAAALFAAHLNSIAFDSVNYFAAWLANPIMTVACVLYLRNVRAAAQFSAVLGLALALTSFLVKGIPDSPKEGDFAPIISYGSGIWWWIASVAVLAVGITADTFLVPYVAAAESTTRHPRLGDGR